MQHGKQEQNSISSGHKKNVYICSLTMVNIWWILMLDNFTEDYALSKSFYTTTRFLFCTHLLALRPQLLPFPLKITAI